MLLLEQMLLISQMLLLTSGKPLLSKLKADKFSWFSPKDVAETSETLKRQSISRKQCVIKNKMKTFEESPRLTKEEMNQTCGWNAFDRVESRVN